MFTFDAGVEFVHEGPRRRRVIFYDSADTYAPDGVAAELVVGFDAEWQPVDVHFRRAGPARATELREFPWRRWFDLCREEIVKGASFDPRWSSSVHQAAGELRPPEHRGPGPSSPLSGQDDWLIERRNQLRREGVRPYWPALQQEVADRFYGGDLTKISIETLQSRIKRRTKKLRERSS